MKITILDTIPGEEDEIIIKCQNLSEDIQNLLQKLKQGNTKIAGYNENGVHLLEPDEIYYFETVDNKVFACCKKEVYEVREKLYTLEGMLFPVNVILAIDMSWNALVVSVITASSLS